MIWLFPSLGFAHGGHHHDENLLGFWNWDPFVISCLLLLLAAYGVGRFRGAGPRSIHKSDFVFGAALLVLVLALLSPIDVLSDDLSWMHMIQHMLIMMVAAPLMVLARPWLPLLWCLPLQLRKSLVPSFRLLETSQISRYLFWQPMGVWLLFAFVQWVWHVPMLYESALRNEWIHDFQHITFFVAAFLFWRVVIDPVARLRLSRGPAVIYLFTTSLHASLLGFFMALATRPWYPEYVGRTSKWGIGALQDQQIAGLIMWMPACAIYAVLAALLFYFWLDEIEERAQTQEP